MNDESAMVRIGQLEEEAGELEGMLDDAEATATRRLGLLRRCEWIPQTEANNIRFCPICKHAEYLGHAADCELAAELAEEK